MTTCECCLHYESHLELVTDNTKYILCHNCIIDLINLRLSKDQYFNLLRNHSPEEFLLHSDFYNDKGEALQPK